ncbi:MAG: IMP dehydrogenase [Patescibacteria group bacterium]
MGDIPIPFGLTFDDVLLEPRKTSVMRNEASVKTQFSKNITIDIPLIAAASDTVSEPALAIALAKAGGIAVLHRNCSVEDQLAMVREVKKAGVKVAAAIGPTDVERARLLDEAGVDAVVMDCAHAHAPGIIEAAKKIKSFLKADFVVGNIVTAEAARDFAPYADAFKVGIGPGSICTTRIVSGVGVPQLTAIQNVVSVAHKKQIPVIADGGIRASGDMVKAFAMGASSVMLGSLFAGTEEAPGDVVVVSGKKYKVYRGMGSKEALEKRHAVDRYAQDVGNHTPEGISGMVPFRGTVKEFTNQMVNGIRSGMGYIGAPTISDIKKQARFIRITSAGLMESHPHSLTMRPEREEQ